MDHSLTRILTLPWRHQYGSCPKLPKWLSRTKRDSCTKLMALEFITDQRQVIFCTHWVPSVYHQTWQGKGPGLGWIRSTVKMWRCPGKWIKKNNVILIFIILEESMESATQVRFVTWLPLGPCPCSPSFSRRLGLYWSILISQNYPVCLKIQDHFKLQFSENRIMYISTLTQNLCHTEFKVQCSLFYGGTRNTHCSNSV